MNIKTSSLNHVISLVVAVLAIAPVLASAQSVGPVGYYWGQQSGNYVQSQVVAQPVIAPGAACAISANPSTIQNGQFSQLSWSAPGAVAATLSDGIGNVAVSGVLPVDPEASRVYVLTVYNQSGTASSCSTALTVVNTNPFISLSQIPYTGLGDSASYWLAIIALAGALSYLLAYSRGYVRKA